MSEKMDMANRQPKTEIEIMYAQLAVLWKERYDEKIKDMNKLKAKISLLEDNIERVKSDKNIEHQEYVALENETTQLSNEVDGLLRRETNVDKRVTAELLNEAAAHHLIDDAISGRKPRTWIRLTWEIVAILTVLVVIWQVGYNPDFREFMGENMFAIVIVVGVLGYIGFSILQKQRKK